MEKVLKVSAQHIWAGIDGLHVSLGLTNYGQSELGRIISVELPEVGDEVESGEPFGAIESVETVSELVSPVSGKVIAVNGDLESRPRTINEDPYNEGWLIEVRLSDESEVKSLMEMDEYYQFVSKPYR